MGLVTRVLSFAVIGYRRSTSTRSSLPNQSPGKRKAVAIDSPVEDVSDDSSLLEFIITMVSW